MDKELKITKQNRNSEYLYSLLVSELDKLKAIDIAVIDLKEKSSFTDFMIVAGGNSSRHINSMSQKIIHFLKKRNLKNISIEGLQKSDWVLIDAGDIILHLFQSEIREFYNLEKMWTQKGEVETFMIGNDF